jgi:hypothetical protein
MDEKIAIREGISIRERMKRKRRIPMMLKNRTGIFMVTLFKEDSSYTF